MKRILTAFTVFIVTATSLFAQETMADDISGWANEWKYAFSKEGVKEWKPEFTARYYAGFYTSGPMLTGGVRIDEKRTLALFIGLGDTYIDHAPSDLYSICTGVNFRRYWHIGKRKKFSFYSDLYVGAGYIYKISGKYHTDTTGEQEEVIDDNVGDVQLVAGWQPGIRARCHKNLNLFFGPTIATDCLGLHLGIGF